MSIHPSLGTSTQNKKLKSVLKRAERIKKLLEEDKWHEGDSVFGLPKIKTVRIKIKKEKAAEKPAEGLEPSAAAPAKTEAEGKTASTAKTQKTSPDKSEK